MGRPSEPWETQLRAQMDRLHQVLAEGHRRRLERIGQLSRQGMPPELPAAWADRKLRKRMWREAYRELRRERRARNAIPGGLTMTGISAVLAFLSTQPDMPHYLVWVALGLGISGVSQLTQGLRYRFGPKADERAESDRAGEPPARGRAQAPAEPADPRIAQVDALCDRLAAELKGGSPALKALGHHPGKTAEALRTACHELVRREREIRAAVPAEEDARLGAERAQLAGRVEREADPIVRERLASALRALDDQLRQRGELKVAASRLEAEHTRLNYTLQSLYTQVLRVKTADAGSADIAGAGLRRSLEELGREIDAVADALAEVHSGVAPVSPISSDEAAPRSPGRLRDS